MLNRHLHRWGVRGRVCAERPGAATRAPARRRGVGHAVPAVRVDCAVPAIAARAKELDKADEPAGAPVGVR